MENLRFQLSSLQSSSRVQENYRKRALSLSFQFPLDRVNVLGTDSYGHTGCVNALSWASNGEVLLSGGDDTTVRIWRINQSDTETPYPFVCDSVIQTGHRGNIFNAHLLPSSTKIATVAGDKEVRVFDAEKALSSYSQGAETPFGTKQTLTRVLRCHNARTKRIITEGSPDLFLTVAEDGMVRQHDLRVRHVCRQGQCPQPLVQLPFELSTISLSSLVPHELVAAGDSPYGYLFDRRNIGRILREEWGMPSTSDEHVTCVRRFGRKGKNQRRGEDHITGSRKSESNGHEVILTYSGDAVYLFSTRDDPTEADATRSPSASSSTFRSVSPEPIMEGMQIVEEYIRREAARTNAALGEEQDGAEPERGDPGDDDEEDEDEEMVGPEDEKLSVPTILPRKRYTGACNVQTVKDVNFIGPDDEFVVSGSDEGYFFVWDKKTSDLVGIYEGDSTVVNVIEQHPKLPLVAVSGIDTTVKLFSPCRGESKTSQMRNVDAIINRNTQPQTRMRRINLGGVSLRYLMQQSQDAGDSSVQCYHQ